MGIFFIWANLRVFDPFPILSFPHVANIGDRARHLFDTNHYIL